MQMILEFSGVQLPNQEEKEVRDLGTGANNKFYVTGFICKDYSNKLHTTLNQHCNSNKKYQLLGLLFLGGRGEQGKKLNQRNIWRKKLAIKLEILPK